MEVVGRPRDVVHPDELARCYAHRAIDEGGVDLPAEISLYWALSHSFVVPASPVDGIVSSIPRIVLTVGLGQPDEG